MNLFKLTLAMAAASILGLKSIHAAELKKLSFSLENTKCFMNIKTEKMDKAEPIEMTMNDLGVGGKSLFANYNLGDTSYKAMARGQAISGAEYTAFYVEASSHNSKNSIYSNSLSGNIILDKETRFGYIHTSSQTEVGDKVFSVSCEVGR